MAERVQPIFSDNPGSLPATYVLPSGLDLVVSSIRARINGASASATFIPCLAILTQDDKLLARVRLDQEFAVGDTGEGTWAPFLKRTPAAAAAAANLPYVHLGRFPSDPSQSIAVSGQIAVRFYHVRTNDAAQAYFRVINSYNAPPPIDETPWTTFGITVSVKSPGFYVAAAAVDAAATPPAGWGINLGTDDYTALQGAQVTETQAYSNNTGQHFLDTTLPFVVSGSPSAEGFYIELGMFRGGGGVAFTWDGLASLMIYRLGVGGQDSDFTPT